MRLMFDQDFSQPHPLRASYSRQSVMDCTARQDNTGCRRHQVPDSRAAGAVNRLSESNRQLFPDARREIFRYSPQVPSRQSGYLIDLSRRVRQPRVNKVLDEGCQIHHDWWTQELSASSFPGEYRKAFRPGP